MAGTTTNFSIPYPSVTDYVTDGATDMRLLAEKVDAVMSSGTPARNLLINGAMQVSQRSAVGTAVAGITTTGYYTADRWYSQLGTLGTWTQTTIADAPTGSGFRNSIKMACTTIDTPSAGDYCVVTQRIEGQNLQALRKGTASAQTVTLSFWVKCFQTGIYIAEIADITNSRQVSKTYTITASGTWQYVSIVFPADVTGTIANDNASGLEINFWLAAGSNYTSGTLQTTWATIVNANRVVGQTNTASSTSNYWQMTGAQLTVGSVSVPFEFKSFADDLRDCQRYYEKSYIQGESVGTNTANGLVLAQGSTGGDSYFYTQLHYKVTKRTKDVNATFWNSSGATNQWSWSRSGATGNTTPSIQYQADNWLQIYILASAAWVSMQAVGHFAVSAEL